jgi:hypothetical protein
MKSAGEKAMALVDGQLAPAEVPALVQELARNATLVAELQDYLATTRSRIALAYAARADEPVPRRLIDAIMAKPPVGQPAARASTAGGRLMAWLLGSYRVPAWSLAAAPTLAAAVAFAVATVVLPAAQLGYWAGLSSEMGAALERTASGKDAALASLRPMLSFNSKNAGWCRQFEVRSAGKQLSHGLACRVQAGDWRVVASTAPSATGGYVPAGTGPRKMIDDIVSSMLVGEPLSSEGEASAIARGWQL